VQAWAAQNNFSPANVYAVLAGRCKGRRGEGHLIAVKLGLKPQIDDVLFKDVVSKKTQLGE